MKYHMDNIFFLDLLEGKQSLSVGDLITLKLCMFLVALFVFLYMLFGYFYMLLSLNRIKVCLQAFVAKNRKKEEKVKEIKDLSFPSRDPIRSSISQRRIQVFITPKFVDKK